MSGIVGDSTLTTVLDFDRTVRSTILTTLISLTTSSLRTRRGGIDRPLSIVGMPPNRMARTSKSSGDKLLSPKKKKKNNQGGETSHDDYIGMELSMYVYLSIYTTAEVKLTL